MIYLKDLIEALREELQQYGEMLARFDDAEAYIALDSPEKTLAALQDQDQVVNLALAKRKRAEHQLARYMGLSEESSLREIVPLLPLEHQLLVQALLEENRELSSRVQQRASIERQLPLRSIRPVEGSFVAARTDLTCNKNED